MKFLIPLLGKTREGYLEAGIRDYAGRLGRFATVELPILKERHGRKDPEEVMKQIEADLLLQRTDSAGVRVALDPSGALPNSEELAVLLSGWEERGVGTVSFLIGGHLGLHSSLLARADTILSLSRLTFTHEMTRLILLEQLYRACTIKAGHKYHK
ncbi:23S rRNA (pseudouridine(1915)-N(3))-methyltransferase RlmH [Desulfobulbus alkaliphilus]|uniref:23S rRNA (pseudouridine(1915)-N(3))-methyltransferase RlmH n=1 Tax=Desulfobulbus alkaliphilus TaxID=869814 RepID=UPI0019663734|nr:23S rRNA (pseudouridine(1915)-N(3))-methyltransferase RlmH [Desulfobulbus alkaliphilus]MBM9537140.1 23S rRNA (pseudouridine(1915)-N(3))-methyltransferase RlmH [Desulfobulbus alkaliphilus]